MNNNHDTTRHTTYRTSSYMRRYLDPHTLEKSVATIASFLEPYLDQFDTLAFRGHSGSILGTALALKLKKNMLLVRKDGEDSHSDYAVEGTLHSRYLIIDDLVASGRTVRKIQEMIFIAESNRQGYNPAQASVCIGIFLEHGMELILKRLATAPGKRGWGLFEWQLEEMEPMQKREPVPPLPPLVSVPILFANNGTAFDKLDQPAPGADCLPMDITQAQEAGWKFVSESEAVCGGKDIAP